MSGAAETTQRHIAPALPPVPPFSRETAIVRLIEDAWTVNRTCFNREALVDLLKKTRETTVELYGVWDGNYTEPPKARECIPLERILASDFGFKEQGFYTIRIGSESSTTPEIPKS